MAPRSNRIQLVREEDLYLDSPRPASSILVVDDDRNIRTLLARKPSPPPFPGFDHDLQPFLPAHPSHAFPIHRPSLPP